MLQHGFANVENDVYILCILHRAAVFMSFEGVVKFLVSLSNRHVM